MIKGKRSKKKPDSEDQYCIDDIVDSQDQEQSIKPKPNQKQFENTQNNKKTNKIEKNQENIKPVGQKLTIAQIKEYIETQIPEMKQQIEMMDDESLRQIYQSGLQQNPTNQQPEQQSKIDRIQNYQPEKLQRKNQQFQNYQQERKKQQFLNTSKKRDPEIQFMLDEIIKNVPHMKDEVELFDDQQIRQLYQTNQGNQESNQKQNGKQVMGINQIKKFLFQKIPEMREQLKILSDQDIVDVYQQYMEKDKPAPNVNKPTYHSDALLNPGYRNNPYQSSKPIQRDLYHSPYQHSKILPNSVKTNPKLQPRINFPIDSQQQKYYGQSNHYKYPNTTQQRNHSPIPDYNRNLGSNHNLGVDNNLQVHTFHNSQRVPNIPYNNDKYARTVVIFHTMDPGYVPQISSQSNCHCPCCLKRQSQMSLENPLNSFIYDLTKKYSISKK